MYRVDIVGNVEIIVTCTTGMSSWNTNTYICYHNGATNHISALIAYQISLAEPTQYARAEFEKLPNCNIINKQILLVELLIKLRTSTYQSDDVNDFFRKER